MKFLSENLKNNRALVKCLTRHIPLIELELKKKHALFEIVYTPFVYLAIFGKFTSLFKWLFIALTVCDGKEI